MPIQQKNSLSYDCIELIIQNIGEADHRMIIAETEALLEQNHELTGNRDGFLYGGTFFSMLPDNKRRHAKKLPLHPSLWSQGEALKRGITEFLNDTQRLKQGLSIVLRDCLTLQDVRDALPNAARMVLPELTSLQRTRPVAWTLQDKPLLLDQYPQTEQLFTYYLSSRMLY
jgi:hypothetical protein